MVQGKANHPEALNKVALRVGEKLDHQEFVVFVHAGMVDKWRKDRSTPLTDVVARYAIYTPQAKHGSSGLLQEASRALLQQYFGSADEAAIIARVLAEGAEEHTARGHDASTSKDRSGPRDRVDKAGMKANAHKGGAAVHQS